jgi:ABC-type multidrug transport system fused ATPase/permease subunit
MTRQKTVTVVRVMGALCIALGLLCACANIYQAGSSVFFGDMGEKINQAQQQQRQRIEQLIAELEQQRETAPDEQQKAQLDTQIEQQREQLESLEKQNQAQVRMLKATMSRPVMIAAVVGAATGLITNILLIIAGIGLLMLRAWGRMVAVIAAILKIINIILVNIVNVVFIAPITQKAMQEMMESMPASMPGGGPPGGFPGMMGNFFEIITIVSAIGSIIVVSAFPVVLLIVLRMQDVKRLLSGQWPESAEQKEEDDLAPREAGKW